jgi:chromosome segregation ATPase
VINRLQARLDELKSEFELGQKKLTEMEAQVANMRSTLLRISGAIQVLEEEIARASQADGDQPAAG